MDALGNINNDVKKKTEYNKYVQIYKQLIATSGAIPDDWDKLLVSVNNVAAYGATTTDFLNN